MNITKLNTKTQVQFKSIINHILGRKLAAQERLRKFRKKKENENNELRTSKAD